MLEAEFANDGVVSSDFTYVELRAALAAVLRHRRFPADRAAAFRGGLETAWAEVGALRLRDDTLLDAAELAESGRLRAGDAVQLAALRRAGDPGTIRFACFDLNLRRAAGELGYDLVPAASEMGAL